METMPQQRAKEPYKKVIQWDIIKGEYMLWTGSMAALGRQFDVNPTTIKYHAKAKRWGKLGKLAVKAAMEEAQSPAITPGNDSTPAAQATLDFQRQVNEQLRQAGISEPIDSLNAQLLDSLKPEADSLLITKAHRIMSAKMRAILLALITEAQEKLLRISGSDSVLEVLHAGPELAAMLDKLTLTFGRVVEVDRKVFGLDGQDYDDGAPDRLYLKTNRTVPPPSPNDGPDNSMQPASSTGQPGSDDVQVNNANQVASQAANQPASQVKGGPLGGDGGAAGQDSGSTTDNQALTDSQAAHNPGFEMPAAPAIQPRNRESGQSAGPGGTDNQDNQDNQALIDNQAAIEGTMLDIDNVG